jgi:hypothetical protein
LAVLLTAACAEGAMAPGSGGQDGGGDCHVPPQTRSYDLPPGVEAVPIVPTGHLPLLSSDEAARLTPMPWSLVGVRDDGATIAISVDASTRVPKGARVAETLDDVTVTVYGTAPPDGLGVAVARHVFTNIALPHPLGLRRLRGC